MALMTVNFFSASLARTVTINVILPADKQMNALISEATGAPYRPNVPEGGFKTLYLLHGVFGNYTDWVTGTRIQRWAEEKDLCVVMPSGDNMSYIDQTAAHDNYGRFIGEELVAITRAMFPLSTKREDTFIGGLSMGGYGAFRNGFKYADTFGYIASLSGAFLVDGMDERTDDDPMFINTRTYAEAVYGDLSKVEGSDKDPSWLAEQLAASGKELPKVYMACGTEDFLYEANQTALARLKKCGYDVTYEEGPGGHEWDFWDTYIKHVVDWLPLGEATQGTNSGNVGL